MIFLNSRIPRPPPACQPPVPAGQSRKSIVMVAARRPGAVAARFARRLLVACLLLRLTLPPLPAL